MLTDTELARIRLECGLNLLTSSAVLVIDLTADGETLVREILARIASVKAEMSTVTGAGTLRAVDEVQFYSTGDRTAFASLRGQLTYWRSELRAACGFAADQRDQLSSY